MVLTLFCPLTAWTVCLPLTPKNRSCHFALVASLGEINIYFIYFILFITSALAHQQGELETARPFLNSVIQSMALTYGILKNTTCQ